MDPYVPSRIQLPQEVSVICENHSSTLRVTSPGILHCAPTAGDAGEIQSSRHLP